MMMGLFATGLNLIGVIIVGDKHFVRRQNKKIINNEVKDDSPLSPTIKSILNTINKTVTGPNSKDCSNAPIPINETFITTIRSELNDISAAVSEVENDPRHPPTTKYHRLRRTNNNDHNYHNNNNNI